MRTNKLSVYRRAIFYLLLILMTSPVLAADPKLHSGALVDVTDSWKTVSLPKNYTNMVVIATPNYGTKRPPVVTRIRNANGSSFQVKVVRPGAGYVGKYRVHYVVAEAGVYAEHRDGITMAARTITATTTDSRGFWNGTLVNYQQPYVSPVVVGQVMTSNDSKWSVFWSRGRTRNTQPDDLNLYVGKHVGGDPDATRSSEKLGFIVIEAGGQSVNGTNVFAGVGNVGSITTNPPYPVRLGAEAAVAVASTTTMNGGDGAHTILWGTKPMANKSIALSLDEDTAGDAERYHIDEAVAYLAVLTSSLPPEPPGEENVTENAGKVRFWQNVSSAFDPVIENATATTRNWMVSHYDRMLTFSSYFDRHTNWFSNAWEYENLYGQTPSSSVAKNNPNWILRDANGNKLYIPFACKNGTCPRYAMDFGNQAYRNWWFNNMNTIMARGNYRGIYLDDVNMTWRVSDGSGVTKTPIDPRTGNPMTLSNWRKYMAQFVEQIKSRFPNKEIVHNLIWYAGETSDPYILRQIDAADFIHLERGFMDKGLRGQGKFSLENFHSFIDLVQNHDKPFLAFGKAETTKDREYDLANYFLMNSGDDLLGEQNLNWTKPTTWWSGFDTELGAPLGDRYVWNGAIRRDFENGMVLVNPPDRAELVLNLPGSFKRLNGGSVSSVTLTAKHGVVLKK